MRELQKQCGAFRTSPCESLYIEAQEPSLSDRRKLLLLQYYVRSKRIPDSIVSTHLARTDMDRRYKNSKRKPKSVGYKLRQICKDLDLNIPNIMKFYQCSLGPWLIPKVQPCFELAQNKKGDTNKEAYWNYFMEHKHPADIEIYTDGSKGENCVGAGGIIINGDESEEFQHKLPNITSIFTAELSAIEVGLSKIKNLTDKSCILYSDSMSSLQAIKSAKVDDKRIGTIYEILHRLKEKAIDVSFCWIPGHANIRGNEIADKKAKEARNLNEMRSLEVSSSDCKSYIKEKIYESWESRWRQLTDNRKLKSVQQTIRRKIPKLSRMDEIKLTRLRIGHTRLTHSFILIGEDVPMCIECERPVTVKHILLECGNNNLDRLECYDHREVTISDLLNKHKYIPKTLEFLKRANLYKEI